MPIRLLESFRSPGLHRKYHTDETIHSVLHIENQLKAQQDETICPTLYAHIVHEEARTQSQLCLALTIQSLPSNLPPTPSRPPSQTDDLFLFDYHCCIHTCVCIDT